MANVKKNLVGSSSAPYPQDGIVPCVVNGVQPYPRLPAMKRPVSAPVSMQGWLQKQGSDGLMLWKKRWFVLSEYCLYYYKNSDEEKVLGSILLPSYKISPCSKLEGKLFRKKFSFKAEHANMRTYYFAADSRERMVQWMNAMSLATIAQEQSPRMIESTKEDFVGSDKLLNVNFHAPGISNSKLNGPTSVRNHESDSVQPLYVNAPPKPRRTAEPSEQSYDRSTNSAQTDKKQEYVFSNGRHFSCLHAKEMSSSDLETRYTPEGYGTPPPPSTTHAEAATKSISSHKMSGCSISDYEELYGLAAATCLRTTKNVVSVHQSVVNRTLRHGANTPTRNLEFANRPRSVDFLQSRENNIQQLRNTNGPSPCRKAAECSDGGGDGCGGRDEIQSPCVPIHRPRSSIDIISDGFHWSEEQYAESMRKSAQYLVPKTNQPHLTRSIVANKVPFSSGGSSSSSSSSVAGGGGGGSGKKNAVTATKSCNACLVKSYFSVDGADSFSNDKCHDDRTTKCNQNDFMRSKSARIVREKVFSVDVNDFECKRADRPHLKELNDRHNLQFQQREESMKRLLEWKQRMLQSPLSRKSLMSSSSRDEFKRGMRKNESGKCVADDIPRPRSTHLPASKDDVFSSQTRQHSRFSTSNGEIASEESKKLHGPPSNTKPNLRELNDGLTDVKNGDSAKNIISHPYKEKLDTNGNGNDNGNANRNGNEKRPTSDVVPFDDEMKQMTMSENSRLFEWQMNALYPVAKSHVGKLSNGESVMEEAYLKISFASNRATSSNEYRSDDSPRTCGEDERTAMNTDEEKCELPPQNIVQDRIKVFEKPADSCRSDGKSVTKMCSRSSTSSAWAETTPQLIDDSGRGTDASEGKFGNQTLPRINEENVFLVSPAGNSIKRAPFRSTGDLLLKVDWEEAYRVCDARAEAESAEKKNLSNASLSECSDTKVSSRRSSIIEDRRLAEEGSLHGDGDEDHYLPMAPCKKPLFNTTGDLFYHTRSNSASSASQIMILETLLSEDIENSYVEMTVGEDKSSHASRPPKVIKSEEVADEKSDSEKSHYELLYKASSSTEPLYMEVVSSKDKSNRSDDKMAEFAADELPSAGVVLPDILSSPSALRQLTDSSDADDEASKEFDPLDIPQHPRFSLSDTFRPASYYLGTGISDRRTLGLSFDQPDSSDSDLVSPPPIPTSPPPLDDFSQSLDMSDTKNEINVEHAYSQDDTMHSDSLPHPAFKSQLECDEGEHSEFSDCNDQRGRGARAGAGDEGQLLEHEEGGYAKWNAVVNAHLSNNIGCDDGVKPFSYPNAETLSERKASDVSVGSDVTSELFSIPSTAANCPPGAPYYYADLLKSDECDKWTYESNKKRDSSDEKLILNNRRVNSGVEFANLSKRNNDVGKKVNQIVAENQLGDRCEKNSTTTTTTTTTTTSATPPPIHTGSVPSYYKHLDDKNIYNAEVFQNKLYKIRRYSESPQSVNDALNSLAHGARIGDDVVCEGGLKTRSVGQLDEFLPTTLMDDEKRTKLQQFYADERIRSAKTSVPSPASGDEELWLEDNLWRETLRKTSLRHARSLDDLDKQNNSLLSSSRTTKAMVTTKSGRQSADMLSSDTTKKSSFVKLSRDVTYVNDCVSTQMRKAKQNSKEYTEDYREIRKIKRYPRAPAGDNAVVDDDDGDGGAGGVGDAHYERLDPRATLAQSEGGIGVGGYYNRHHHHLHHQQRQQQHERAGRQNGCAIDSMKQHGKNNTQPKTGAQSFLEEGVYPTKPPSFEIDREKLRQWDLMSSAPVAMLNAIQRYPVAQVQAYEMERNGIRTALATECTPPNSPALDSDFATGRSLPSPQNRVPHVRDPVSPIIKNEYSAVVGSIDDEHQFQNQPEEASASVSVSPIRRRVTPDELFAARPTDEFKTSYDTENTWNLNVSAGELLGRTHEELVLLLIQLRRQSASLCKAMENCHYEIESQATLLGMHKLKKFARTDHVEELKKRLMELEKQYEKGKPLVNLVDNMVKLGSLYRNAPANQFSQFKEHSLKSKIEFNDRIQEHRLVVEERKEWERVHSDHNGLQVKVEELYKLDRELQRESTHLQNLKQDKDLLEYALRGLKCKMQGIHGNPSEMERYKRQQLILEHELTYVRAVLASNSKKLEETVAANAKLEAELVILRQKLQLNHRPSQENAMTAPTIAALENELRRVQMLVGNLQRQRAELNSQVRQLTEKSKNLCRQAEPTSTGFADTDSDATKKRNANSWIETDLDKGVVQNASEEKYFNNVTSSFDSHSFVSLYCNPQKASTATGHCDTTARQEDDTTLCAAKFSELFCSPICKERRYCEQIDIGESDDKTKRFYGIIPREKSQEIKTVRIVKRESERRQRDRDRNNVGIPVTLNPKRSSFPENFVSADTVRYLNEVVAEEKESYLVSSGITTVNTVSAADCGRRRENISSSPTTASSECLPFGGISNGNEKDNNVRVCPSESSENNCAAVGNDAARVHQRDSKVKLFFEKLNKNQNETTTAAAAEQPSSIYQSKAANEIVEELISKVNADRKNCTNRRTPKEKRRHHTISNNKPIIPLDCTKESARARDDIDMERALRPRLNGTPDVVRSTLCRSDSSSYNVETIDNVIGTPEKIFIPERYVPENTPQLSPEERDKRLKKAEAIRKMLSETSAFSAAENDDLEKSEISLFNKNKIEEKRKQRDHILQLNQILAHQVMEKSKLVAEVGTMFGS